MKRKGEDINENNATLFKAKKNKNQIITKEERERKKTSYFRPPTTEELNELKENENLYKNNLFRMQIDYLLEEVKLKEKSKVKLNEILHSLNTFLTEIKCKKKERQLSDEKCCPKGINFPILDIIERSKLKGNFKFVPPTDIKVIGSYLLGTINKQNSSIDIAVEMPKECFQPRDCINFRYHYKRAYYLSWLASFLKNWQHLKDLNFFIKGDIHKPCLELSLKGKIGQKFVIHIHIAIPSGIFKVDRFAPLKNNVRSNWYEGLNSAAIEEIEFPTGNYNSNVLSDMLYETHLHTLYDAIKECPGIKDAICLIKIWLQQRCFQGEQPFNGFIVSMLMVYLLRKRKISPHMSSYQVFRLLLNYITTSDWTQHGISLCENQDEKSPLNDFHEAFDVVFVDTTGYLNLATNINIVSYEMVKEQANLSMEILDKPNINSFECLFIKRHHFIESVDHIFRVFNLDEFKKRIKQNDQYKFLLMNHGGDWTKVLIKMIHSILNRGLGERITELVLKPPARKKWSVNESPINLDEYSFSFGVCLNTEQSEETLIMGPPAEKPEAKEFRELWGDKSELRRFQDGNINEAVLFKCKNMLERKLITKRIILHLLHLHLSIPETSVGYHVDEADSILSVKYQMSPSAKVKPPNSCGYEESEHFMRTYDELCKEIRSIDDLPLSINSIQGIDSSFRLTDVVPSVPYQNKNLNDSSKSYILPKYEKRSTWCPRHCVNIQFESTGKWPDEIEAIKHVKAAFHVKLAQLMRSRLNLTTAAAPSYVDVLKNGFVFRLYVTHYREIMLYKEADVSAQLKKEYEIAASHLNKSIVQKPLHTSLIHGLTSRYHSFALTTRLCKRWLASQLLSDYYNEEVIELIVASLFLKPYPFKVPNSHLSGFIRFLNFKSTFDWENEPLIVDINNSIAVEDYQNIEENFSTHRAHLPPMFIATSYDMEGSLWTKQTPSSNIIRRTTCLATEALRIVNENEVKLSNDIIKQLFRPSLEDYAVVIELNKTYVPMNYLSIDSNEELKYTKLKSNIKHSTLPVTGYDPVRLYVDELKEAFSDIALFFHDRYGGLNIGVVWKNEAYEIHSFKILRSKYKTIVKSSSKSSEKKGSISAGIKVKPNLSAIVSDFRVIGKDLVKDVKVIS